jgi:hypothetical protein
MSVQQMVEHMTVDAVRIANGRLKIPLATSSERLPAYREFLMSDRPFRENTNNPLLPNEPRPPYYNTVQAAISALQQELIYFFEAFAENPQLITHNPIFGELNFEENVQLLYKHAIHHLRQFGVEPLNL